MQRLSGVDAAFLYMETPAQHMHGVGVTVVDPSTIPGGYDFDAMRAEFVRRLVALPGFRRRLVQFPFGLDHPAWIDARVELASHIIRATLPEPGSQQQFEEFVGHYASEPLRRDRPLWQFCLLEGLEGGRMAILAKVHHCIVDGVSGAQMLREIYDLEPVAPPRELHPEGYGEDEATPSLFQLAAASIAARVGDPARAAAVVRETLVSAAEAIVSLSADANITLPMAAPATPFSHALTPRRAVSFARASLADVKLLRTAFGATVNDVVLAACTIALRRRLDEAGVLPDRPLVASVPVSARRAGEEASSFNRVSAMFIGLPVHIEDSLGVVREIAASTAAAKKIMASMGANLLGEWVELLPPLLFAQAMQLYSALKMAERHAPVHNLVISNVPGPPFPFFAGGARVLAVYPLGPILEGAALNVTVFSYQDAIDIGVVTCPSLAQEVGSISTAFVEAIDELKRCAGA
ncbi:MAG TPA: wax ester/triacylglycerol synthase family O-acyltransferase [Candidatus Binatia bacterium]|jgi:WS/DGAT/MGAT family acyltransferase